MPKLLFLELEVQKLEQSIIPLENIKKKAQDSAWIPLFMGEYRYLASQGLYDEPSSEKEQKYLIKAHGLYKKRFSYSPFFGTLEEPELINTAFAIH